MIRDHKAYGSNYSNYRETKASPRGRFGGALHNSFVFLTKTAEFRNRKQWILN